MREPTVKVDPHKSSLGEMDANILALLVYLAPIILAWIPVIKYLAWAIPLVIFFIEKKSNFVRFHSMQAILLSVVGAIIVFIISVIILGAVTASYYYSYGGWGAIGLVTALALIVTLVIVVFEIIAMVNAYGYKEYRIPLIGNLAAKLSGKLATDTEIKNDTGSNK